jgi:hypothetical protein
MYPSISFYAHVIGGLFLVQALFMWFLKKDTTHVAIPLLLSIAITLHAISHQLAENQHPDELVW